MTLPNLVGKASGDVKKPLQENTDATEEARSPKEQELYTCQEDISFQLLSVCERNSLTSPADRAFIHLIPANLDME